MTRRGGPPGGDQRGGADAMRAPRPGLASSPGTVPPGCRALRTTGSATREQLDLQVAASVEFEMVQQRLFS